MSETPSKISLLRSMMVGHHLDATLLQRVSSTAWATGGALTYVNIARDNAEVYILVTADHQYLVTTNIEAPRLEKEENLASQGWDFQVTPWYEEKEDTIRRLTSGLKVGSDVNFPGGVDLSGEIAHLRANLSPEEGDRFRLLSQLSAQAMDAAARAVRPGQTEHEIEGILAGEAAWRGVQAIVNLIAVDERIFSFRHPLPTHKKLDRYAMLVLCGRRWGLVCSLTRLVYFGKLPPELHRKAQAVARVDAAMIAASRPGRTLGEIFKVAQAAYAGNGYPDEWRYHHQGGPAGYEPREYLATPDSRDSVIAGQVYAWNPSITGCKSEDSILVGEDGAEVLTSIPGWPAMNIELDNHVIQRPGILVVD